MKFLIKLFGDLNFLNQVFAFRDQLLSFNRMSLEHKLRKEVVNFDKIKIDNCLPFFFYISICLPFFFYISIYVFSAQCMQDFVVDPRNQQVENFEVVLSWKVFFVEISPK